MVIMVIDHFYLDLIVITKWIDRNKTFYGILRDLTDIVPCSLSFSPMQALLTEGGRVTYMQGEGRIAPSQLRPNSKPTEA